MNNHRRWFIAYAGRVLGAGWLALHWPAITAAATSVGPASPNDGPFQVVSPGQARVLEAMAAEIIPSDHTPGAREAGAIYFIDRALGTFFSAHRTDLLTDCDEFAADVSARTGGSQFSDLGTNQRIEHLKRIENGRFFGQVRFLTVVGFLASPNYGGNREQIGWKVTGFDDSHGFSPPFGYYDREYTGFIPYDSKSPK